MVKQAYKLLDIKVGQQLDIQKSKTGIINYNIEVREDSLYSSNGKKIPGMIGFLITGDHIILNKYTNSKKS